MKNIIGFYWLSIASTAWAEYPIIINVNIEGGWDPVMVFENKSTPQIDTDIPSESIAGKLKWMSHNSRPNVDNFMRAQTSRITIVNGLYIKGIDANDTLITFASTKASSTSLQTDYLTWYASEALPRGALPHLVIDSPTASGSLGGKSFSIRMDEVKRWKSDTRSIPSSFKTWSSYNFDSILAGRTSKNLDSKKLEILKANQTNLLSYRSFFSGVYDPSLSLFKNRILCGLQAIKAGYTKALTVRHGSANEWDTRSPSSDHFTIQSQLYNSLFADLSWLVEELEKNDLGSKTIIVVKSNLGKNPKLNSNNGKNPWPYTSMLIWTKLWAAGRTAGASDNLLMGKSIDPIFGNEGSADATNLNTDHIYAAIFNKLNMPTASLFGKTKPAQLIFLDSIN